MTRRLVALLCTFCCSKLVAGNAGICGNILTQDPCHKLLGCDWIYKPLRRCVADTEPVCGQLTKKFQCVNHRMKRTCIWSGKTKTCSEPAKPESIIMPLMTWRDWIDGKLAGLVTKIDQIMGWDLETKITNVEGKVTAVESSATTNTQALETIKQEIQGLAAVTKQQAKAQTALDANKISNWPTDLPTAPPTAATVSPTSQPTDHTDNPTQQPIVKPPTYDDRCVGDNLCQGYTVQVPARGSVKTALECRGRYACAGATLSCSAQNCLLRCDEGQGCEAVVLEGSWKVDCVAGESVCNRVRSAAGGSWVPNNDRLVCADKYACTNSQTTCPAGRTCTAQCEGEQGCSAATFQGSWRLECSGSEYAACHKAAIDGVNCGCHGNSCSGRTITNDDC